MGRTGFRDQFWLRNEDGTRVLLLLSFVTRIFMKSDVGNIVYERKTLYRFRRKFVTRNFVIEVAF